MTNSSSLDNKYLDFDLDINDYNKLKFLVKNITEPIDYATRKYDCDAFSDNECHHKENHKNHLESMCSFCLFYEYLRRNNTLFKVNDKKHELLVKYKKSTWFNSYHQDLIDWCEFQPWRTPYGLICYAYCSTSLDLMNSINKYEKLKEIYKNCSISCRLFIDVDKRHENNDDLYKLLNLSPQPRNQFNRLESTISFDTNSDRTTDFSLTSTSDFADGNSLLDNNTSIQTNNSDFNQTESSLYDLNSIKTDDKEILINNNEKIPKSNENKPLLFEEEIELKKKIKSIEFEIVTLDFQNAEFNTKKELIDVSLQECVNLIFKKLFNIIKMVNINDDSQINFYSDVLKLPIEKDLAKKQATQSSSLLSIKMINKKKIAARINKYKGDLSLALNMIDSAVNHYYQAYAQCKKEKERDEDNLWTFCSLEGLCISSYMYAMENKQQIGERSNSSGKKIVKSESFLSTTTANITKNKKLKDLTKSFAKTFTSTTNEASMQVVSINEFAKNFDSIIQAYNNFEYTKFIAFETALMIIRFFIQNNFIQEAMGFLNHAIYISNLQIKEEMRIRRYYEIGKLYEAIDMKRLCSFYKWVSIVRIFKLVDKTVRHTQDVHLKCLVNRCIKQLFDLFGDMKIFPQKTPIAQASDSSSFIDKGFPLAKIHLLGQMIQLTSYNSNFNDSIRFAKYIVHELNHYLSEDEFKYFLEFYATLIPKALNASDFDSESFFRKFYKYPLLSSFQISTRSLGLNRMTKIKTEDTNSKSIYIHRYENPLLASKKPTIYNLLLNEPSKIEMIFSNPSLIDLTIEKLDLIAQSLQQINEYTSLDFKIELFQSVNEKDTQVRKRDFVIPAKQKNHKSILYFIHKNSSPFKIIGYEIFCLKTVNTVMFDELSLIENLNSKNFKYNDSLIHPQYNIEMIPKLPLINDVRLFTQSSCDNSIQKYSAYLSEGKNLTIDCKLGTCEYINFDFIVNQDVGINPNDESVEIIEFNFTILNEKILEANKLNTKIDVVELSDTLSKKAIKVDATQYFMEKLMDEADLDLSCFIEIKYTSQLGKQNNLCHVLRSQVFIKFIQPILLEISNISDLNENDFEAFFLVKNLLDQPIELFEKNKSVAVVEKFCQIEIKTTMKKLELKKDILSSNNLIDMFNQSLSLSLNKVNNLCLGNLNKLLIYRNNIFKCPIQLSIDLSILNDQSNTFLHGFNIIGKLKNQEIELDPDNYFTLKLKNKLKLKMFPSFNECKFKELMRKKCLIQQLNLISNKNLIKESHKDKLFIQLSLKHMRTLTDSKNFHCSITWNFKYDFETKEVYYVLHKIKLND